MKFTAQEVTDFKKAFLECSKSKHNFALTMLKASPIYNLDSFWSDPDVDGNNIIQNLFLEKNNYFDVNLDVLNLFLDEDIDEKLKRKIINSDIKDGIGVLESLWSGVIKNIISNRKKNGNAKTYIHSTEGKAISAALKIINYSELYRLTFIDKDGDSPGEGLLLDSELIPEIHEVMKELVKPNNYTPSKWRDSFWSNNIDEYFRLGLNFEDEIISEKKPIKAWEFIFTCAGAISKSYGYGVDTYVQKGDRKKLIDLARQHVMETSHDGEEVIKKIYDKTGYWESNLVSRDKRSTKGYVTLVCHYFNNNSSDYFGTNALEIGMGRRSDLAPLIASKLSVVDVKNKLLNEFNNFGLNAFGRMFIRGEVKLMNSMKSNFKIKDDEVIFGFENEGYWNYEKSNLTSVLGTAGRLFNESNAKAFAPVNNSYYGSINIEKSFIDNAKFWWGDDKTQELWAKDIVKLCSRYIKNPLKIDLMDKDLLRRQARIAWKLPRTLAGINPKLKSALLFAVEVVARPEVELITQTLTHTTTTTDQWDINYSGLNLKEDYDSLVSGRASVISQIKGCAPKEGEWPDGLAEAYALYRAERGGDKPLKGYGKILDTGDWDIQAERQRIFENIGGEKVNNMKVKKF